MMSLCLRGSTRTRTDAGPKCRAAAMAAHALARHVPAKGSAGPKRLHTVQTAPAVPADRLASRFPDDAPFQLFPADPEGTAGRRRGDLARPDGAGRPGSPARRGPVDLPARRVARAQAGRADPARGDGPHRRARDVRCRSCIRAELWDRTGRSSIPELFKLEDRNGRPLVLAMTHEESVTFHVVARRALLPRPAADALPHPDQGARRAAPARGRPAHARVRDEGLLQLRPRRGRASRSPTRATPRPTTASSTAAACAGTGSSRTSGMMGGLGRTSTWRPAPAGENEVALSDAGLRGERRGRDRHAEPRPPSPRRSRSPSAWRRRTRARSRRCRACWESTPPRS